MSAHTAPTLISANDVGHQKRRIMSIVGSASYDVGGSIVDLSTATLGTYEGFSKVHGITQVGGTAAAAGAYKLMFVPAAAYAAATAKIYVTLVEQATPAEASGSLAAVTFLIEVIGV